MSKRLAINLVSALLIGGGFVGLWVALRKSVTPVPSTAAPSLTSNAPSADKPTTAQKVTHSAAADAPKYLSIPVLEIKEARVFALGVRQGEIVTPSNVFDAGWYQDSAKPGQDGAMFMYGHRSSWQTDGLFRNLGKLKAGDSIEVKRGDDKSLSYKVVTTKVYPKDHVDMNEVLSTAPGVQSGLNLMTCTGTVVKGTNDFTERLVVFTQQTTGAR